MKTDLFDGVDLTWNRVPGGAKVGKLVEGAIRGFDAGNPAASVAGLAAAYEAMNTVFQKDVLQYQSMEMLNTAIQNRAKAALVNSSFWVSNKLNQLGFLKEVSTGIYLESNATTATASPGQKAKISIEVVNRSAIPMVLEGITLNRPAQFDSAFSIPLTSKAVTFQMPIILSANWPISQPYWLIQQGSLGMYQIPDSLFRNINSANEAQVYKRQLIGRPEYLVEPSVTLKLKIDGKYISRNIPIRYKHTDPTLGELYQPLVVTPPVMVNLPAARAYIFADAQPKAVPVTLRAGRAGVRGSLALALPAGWKCEPATFPFALAAKDEELTVNFQVQPLPSAAPGHAELRAIATLAPLSPLDARNPGEGSGVRQYTRGIQKIEYPHIPTQFLSPEAVAPLVKLDLRRGKAQNVAYLMGAGDEVPDALRQMGYTVTLLKPEELSAATLKPYDALVVGIRAYNTVEALKTRQPEILKYIEGGGNVVVQYVVDRGTVLPEIGPYPLTLSRDRVTVEDAPVTLTTHPLLQTPNKITAQDFQGWVQEQGLYYPSKWDPKYQTVISSHDPGEADKQSAILVADYGKGHYIYTGLSFFRELPAGVPGAFRLLANMVSYGK